MAEVLVNIDFIRAERRDGVFLRMGRAIGR
jgi:hypothetical protein